MTTEVKRRRGQPLIIPPDGGEPIPYARPSKIAKVLDNTYHLDLWKLRMVVYGLVKSPELMDLAASLADKHDYPVDDAKAELNDIAKRAQDAAKAQAPADTGTALHTFTEVLDLGRQLTYLPPIWEGHVQSYVEARKAAGVKVLEKELFVVNDELRCAGTLDTLAEHAGRVVIDDLKTGKSDAYYPMAPATQVSIYANAQRYDPTTGERSPIHPDLDRSIGLLTHMPSKTRPGTCSVYELNLNAGYQAARLAVAAKTLQAYKTDDWVRLIATHTAPDDEGTTP